MESLAVNINIYYVLGVRSDVNIGNITHYDLLAVLPFDSRLMITKITGKDILASLENSVRR